MDTQGKTLTAELTARVYGDEDGLFVYLPSAIRNRYEVVVGDRFYCVLQAVSPSDGQDARPVEHEGWWEIKGYWHELHIPPQLVTELGLRPGHHLTLRLERVEKGRGY
jgi:hypothetical protein